MILLWVMSILVSLTWAIAQLEALLHLDIKTAAIYQRRIDAFQQAERALLSCERHLVTLVQDGKSGAVEHCKIRRITQYEQVSPEGSQLSSEHLFEVIAGDRLRLRTVVRYRPTSGNQIRISWQPINE
jgi:hypothetical protein